MKYVRAGAPQTSKNKKATRTLVIFWNKIYKSISARRFAVVPVGLVFIKLFIKTGKCLFFFFKQKSIQSHCSLSLSPSLALFFVTFLITHGFVFTSYAT